jgi:hypothetical protein
MSKNHFQWFAKKDSKILEKLFVKEEAGTLKNLGWIS